MERSGISVPQATLFVLSACIFVGIVWALSTSGVALDPYNADWDGASQLRETLGEGGASVDVTLQTDAYDEKQPDRTVAVLLAPEANDYAAEELARVSAFVANGGRLVVATEDEEGNDFLEELGVTTRVDGRPLRDESHNYRSPLLPRATNVSEHELVRDVDALTLNNGTAVRPGEGTALVSTSIVGYLDSNGNGRLDAAETMRSYPVAWSERVGSGRVVIVSDASAFTNVMLALQGNRQFVRNLAGDRDRALIDYSGSRPLAPLTYFLVVLRDSGPLQAAAGLAGLGVILVVSRFWSLGGQDRKDDVAVDEAELSAYISHRYPDWNETRVRRVAKGIIRQNGKTGNDD